MKDFENFPKISITNILVIFSFFWFLLNHFGFYQFFLSEDILFIFFNFFIFTFFHWSIFHFISNSIFLFYFWNIIEENLWKNKFLIFFIFSVIFEWIFLYFLADYNTIWISWFCMAVLSYYTLDLKFKNNPDYKWWINFLILNILIWFMPWISLLWHLFWAISWVVFYFLNKIFLRKK